MFGTEYYNRAIDNTVKGFGTLFNNIKIVRKDPTTGEVLQKQRVPLAYGPRAKFETRLEQNPELQKKAITLPFMYFEMIGLSRDSSKQLPPITKILAPQTDESGNNIGISEQYVPVAYDFDFEVGFMVKDTYEGNQILEQILPFFQPYYNITINFIPDMNEYKDVKVNLSSVDYEDDWLDDFSDRRKITYTLRFVVKSYIYGPYTKADTIKKATIFETAGGLGTPRRAVKRVTEVDPLKDYDGDGDIDTADRDLVSPADTFNDDYGFSLDIFEGDDAQS
jgi:hypothetical protein